MNYRLYLPGLICFIAALVILFRLMHYAHFYAPSYFFWIGAIIALVGGVSLIKPLAFLFILNRGIAVSALCGGLLVSIVALYWPTSLYHSQTNQELDVFLPEYSFCEYHEVVINASPEKVKQALHTTAVADIPAILFLMKIRGIAKEKDLSDKVTNNPPNSGTFSTPDFNFIVVDSTEMITVMVLKASAKTPPPVVSTKEQFLNFNEPGYVKVAVNFRIIPLENGLTLLSTETRNHGVTEKDRRVFGRYWRMIYPGSAIIRRVWLDTLAKKAINDFATPMPI
jgi:hypothetical protein